jgi:hypothetical protein
VNDERIPDLDRKDLETIAILVRDYGKKNMPVFSKRLMEKVNRSLESYKTSKNSIITWPEGTEYLSQGPFFEVD